MFEIYSSSDASEETETETEICLLCMLSAIIIFYFYTFGSRFLASLFNCDGIMRLKDSSKAELASVEESRLGMNSTLFARRFWKQLIKKLSDKIIFGWAMFMFSLPHVSDKKDWSLSSLRAFALP